MDELPVIRLFRFRPAHPEFDQTLRTTMLPDLRRLPGLVDVHVGRHGPEDGDRIVVSVWAERRSMIDGLGESLDKPVFHVDRLADTTDRTLEIHPLEVDLRFDLDTPATILRLFRGTVRPGELDAYIEDARAGTMADAAGGRGPNALYLASVVPDRFITVSLWPDWTRIEKATGGDVHRPIVTRDPRRIVEMDVVHYEVVPEAI